ncbi:SCO6745 family protein [Nocardia thailandica]|uniref:SalK n=1 Tax=Nocardia thailandica TaxID=257275 RepID=A0ABW6PKC2_9NOCA
MGETGTARRIWELIEPVHALVYFAPEARAAFDAAGYRGYWMGYFAGRAAPLGAVGVEVVDAVFYNFAVARVARAVPSAWGFAGPERALAARLSASVAALRRVLGAAADGPEVARAGELAARAAAGAPRGGRALFAANQGLDVPDEPLARLWHAATLLREHRGDGHVAALLAAGIGGRESHVLHALSAGFTVDTYRASRDFTDEEWSACLDSLTRKGLAADGTLTERGRAVKAGIEDATDRLAAEAYSSLSATEVGELITLLEPIAGRIAAGGEIPRKSPMGLDLSRR